MQTQKASKKDLIRTIEELKLRLEQKAGGADTAFAEAALARERDLLQSVFNSAGRAHLVYLDRDFNFVRVNETYAATAGYRPEEMIGKNHFALYPNAENEAIFRQVRDTGEPFEIRDKPFEFPDHPERGVTYWDWTLIPVKDSGRVTGLILSLYETTARVRAEAAVRDSRAKLQAAFANMREAIFIADAGGQLIEFNDEFVRFYRFRDRDECSRSITDYQEYLEAWLPDGTPAPPEKWAMARALSSETASNVEFRLRRKDTGEIWWGSYSFAPIRDRDGRITGAVVAGHEITKRKEAEAHNNLLSEILQIFNRGGDLEPVMSETLRAIQRTTEFDAVGLRLRKDDNYPYFEQNGFTDEFIKHENFLCALDGKGSVIRDDLGRALLECTCGLVLSGKTDPNLSCFTPSGVCWTNRSKDLLALPHEDDPRTNPRNRCIHAGYQSVGLFPVRSGQEIIGLLQLNDRREGRFTPESLGFYESLAQNIGLAIQRTIAEDALRESEKKYRILHENMVEVAHLWKIIRNEDGQIKTWRLVDANPAALKIWNMELKDIVGKTADEIYPGSTAIFFDMVQRLFATDAPISFEEYYPPPLDKHFRFTSVPFGEYFITTGSDITIIKKSEKAIRESEAKYRNLFQHMLEGFAYCRLIFDEECRPSDFIYLAVNDEFGRLTGLKNVIGRRVTELIPEIKQVNPEVFEIYGRVASTGNPEQFEIYFKPLSMYLSISAYCPEKGHFVAIFNDITENKKAEEERMRSQAALETAVQERTRELSQTAAALGDEVTQRIAVEQELRQRSNQLRALASELTLAEQRERMRLAQVLHDGLQQILVAAKFRVATAERSQNLKTLIHEVTDLLDDAIETSRSLTSELSPPILREGGLIPAIEWLVRWMRDKHNLNVRLKVRNNIEQPSQDVVLMLFQATRELLFNVVKHAMARTANLEVEQSDGCLRVSVEDNGIGFEPSEIPAKRENSGGFGLFSIRERISLLGGSMNIDSTIGKGSRFELVIPLSGGIVDQARAGDSSPIISLRRELKSSGGQTSIRIVLVDDHIIVRQGIAGLLSGEADFEIVGEASDGLSAVNLVREVHPQVVLMDISMPGMNGIEATRIIHREFPDVQIIGLSMYVESDQAAAMREAGAANYITKSGPGEELIKAIRSSIRSSKSMRNFAQ